MIPWTLAAALLSRVEAIGSTVAFTALEHVHNAATYCMDRACERFAAELDDCCQVAESARGR